MMRTTGVIVILVAIIVQSALAADDSFDAVVANLLSPRPFKNQEIVRDLRMLASQENASNNLTAQITLVLYLMDRDTTDMSRQEMEEPFNICRQLIESSPGYWQSELAKLYLVFEPSYTGDTNQQLLLIQDALSAVDFDLLDKTDNEVLNAMKQIYTQGEDSSWKDVLLVIRANALCEEDRLIEAEEVVKSITSEKHRKLMQDRVALGKKMRAQRNKIDPSPK